MTTPVQESLWTVAEVATYMHLPVETLYAWRKRGYGPPAARLGRHLRYDPAEVRSWFKGQVA
jgi:excisionase family DNA binding protein